MKLTLSPVADSSDTVISVAGDTLTIDGTPYDFSGLADGATILPGPGSPFIGPVSRQQGSLTCTVLYRYDTATALADQPDDPEAYRFELSDGPVPDPLHRS